MNLEAAYQQAASAIFAADALLIGAVQAWESIRDCPTFAVPKGFWRGVPGLSRPAVRGNVQSRLGSARTPAGLGFFGHCLTLDRATAIRRLREPAAWGESRRLGCSVFTSNVDGHFHSAGFPPSGLWSATARSASWNAEGVRMRSGRRRRRRCRLTRARFAARRCRHVSVAADWRAERADVRRPRMGARPLRRAT